MSRLTLFLTCLCSAVLLGMAGCDALGDGTTARPRIVQDGTPYIVGVIEATPDTAAFYGPPEVFVGTVEDKLDVAYFMREDPSVGVDEAIWSPTLFGQVAMFLDRLHLRPTPDAGATVSITGPLGRAGESAVALTHRRDGVYSDAGSALTVVAGSDYRLDVTLSSGVKYTATGHVPTLPAWTLPDSLDIPLRLSRYASGNPKEEGQVELPEPTYSPDAPMTVLQSNYDHDWSMWGLESGEEFLHQNRGQFRREGSMYLIGAKSTDHINPQLALWRSLCKEDFRDSITQYRRLSEIGPELAAFYWSEFNDITQPNPEGAWELHVRRIWGNEGFGPDFTEYLFSLGNIRSESASARPALGVFGGYSSLYRSVVMVPQRQFDPAAVTDWPCR